MAIYYSYLCALVTVVLASTLTLTLILTLIHLAQVQCTTYNPDPDPNPNSSCTGSVYKKLTSLNCFHSNNGAGEWQKELPVGTGVEEVMVRGRV